jgi:hypothetical protein
MYNRAENVQPLQRAENIQPLHVAPTTQITADNSHITTKSLFQNKNNLRFQNVPGAVRCGEALSTTHCSLSTTKPEEAG